VPQLSPEKFKAICTGCEAYNDPELKNVIDTILDKTMKEIYCEEDPLGKVGWLDKKG